MFKHPGKKLMTLSRVLTIAGIIASAALGALIALKAGEVTITGQDGQILSLSRSQGIILGVAVFVLGAVCSWICGLLMYSFGQLVHHTRENNYFLGRIAEHTKKEEGHKPLRPAGEKTDSAPAGDGPLFHPTHHGD